MKKHFIILIICLHVANCYSQNKHNLPSDYGEMCFRHIEELASYGIRATDLESEFKTINYLASKFREYGLDVKIDTFEYSTFQYDSTVIFYNNEQIEHKRIFINPYLKEFSFESELFFLNTTLIDLKNNLSDKIVLAPESYNFFDLFKIDAKVIVVVRDSLYQKIKGQNINANATLKLYGNIKKQKSYNIIGSLSSVAKNPKDLIISAHWDSKVGQGADDDASGISVILELAKYFKQVDRIPFDIKFIAFGAEEAGMQGSCAYHNKHLDELKDCILNINLDCIGGKGDIMIETHISFPDEIKIFQNLPISVRFCSQTDEKHSWILISPDFYRITLFTENNKIDWIDKTIHKASEDINIKFWYGLSDGDHRMLALSGIPVIGINVPGNKYHVPGDIPKTINKSSLENVGKLVKELIVNIQINE